MISKALHLVGTLQLYKLMGRLVSISTHPFTEYFKGFERVGAVRLLFGDRTEEVLHNLKVDFTLIGGYMGVNGSNGHLMVNPRYLIKGDKLDIYLDIVHELVHIRQHMERKQLFDDKYSYVERPTEVEAYRVAVEEARRLGLSDKRICRYLKVEWMSDEELNHLAKAVNVKFL